MQAQLSCMLRRALASPALPAASSLPPACPQLVRDAAGEPVLLGQGRAAAVFRGRLGDKDVAVRVRGECSHVYFASYQFQAAAWAGWGTGTWQSSQGKAPSLNL